MGRVSQCNADGDAEVRCTRDSLAKSEKRHFTSTPLYICIEYSKSLTCTADATSLAVPTHGQPPFMQVSGSLQLCMSSKFSPQGGHSLSHRTTQVL
jgi:hypothetical protein